MTEVDGDCYSRSSFVPVSSSRSSSYRCTSFAPGHTSLVILLDKLLNLKYFELAASFTRSPRWNPFVCFSLPSNRVFASCHPPSGSPPPAAMKGRRWSGAAIRRAVLLQERRAQQLPMKPFPELTSRRVVSDTSSTAFLFAPRQKPSAASEM